MNGIGTGAALAAAVALLLPAAAHGADARTVYADSPLIAPVGPAAAPDGSVWFGEAGASRLGRIAPDGALTEVAVPAAEHPSATSDGLRVDAVGPDGRVWFVRDGESRVGVLDPATGAVRLDEAAFSDAAVTVTADGAVWIAGDDPDRGDHSAALRIAPDGTRTVVDTGGDRVSFAIAPAGESGAVVIVLKDLGSLDVVHVDADGATRPIRLPAGTGGAGNTNVASGPTGTFIAADGKLLRVDADLVARAVAGVRTADHRRAVGLAPDGSIWLTPDAPLDPVVRFNPGAPAARFAALGSLFKERAFVSTEGIAVAASNDAWVAVSGAGSPARERLLRYSPAGAVSELVLGSPPAASATVLTGGSADLQAGALARGLRTRLRVRIRCTAACSVRVAARDGFGARGTKIYAQRTVRLQRAGTRIVTLRATRRAPRKSASKDFRLDVRLQDRSGYRRQTVAERHAGSILERP